MKLLRLLPLLLLLACVFACKSDVPGEYIQPDELEDILYDYHLAGAMANTGDAADVPYDITLYREAALHKHGITQAQLDSSLAYYMRHADKLHDVYEKLTKRFEDEAVALGASANDIRRYGDMQSSRDTSNLWAGVPSAMLMPVEPYNVMSFEIVADSTYHKGDKLIFSFDCSFISRDRRAQGVALLSLVFTNDSVASSSIRMPQNSNYSVTVADGDRKGIKAVRGFIYLDNGGDERDRGVDGGVSLMFVDNIRLVRMRGGIAPVQPEYDGRRKAAVDTARRPVPGHSQLLDHKPVQAGGRLTPVKVEAKPVRVAGPEKK